MPGQVHQQIQRLIVEGSRDNPTKASYIRTKLILKGIDPDKWGPTSDDSIEVLSVLQRLSQTLIGTSA